MKKIFVGYYTKLLCLFVIAMTFASCGQRNETIDLEKVPDMTNQVAHIEPLSWWLGMNTPLQIMINGENISNYDLSIEKADGVRINAIHKADSPNYIFVDVEVSDKAKPGVRYFVFTPKAAEGESFKVAYHIDARRAGSAERKSFTTADAMYLLMPDRFANGDPSNDSTEDTAEKGDRDAFFGRHGGDLKGMSDHVDYIADLGFNYIWPTPLLLDDEPEESYHGYACCDYYKIDPRFGTNDDYKDFVENCHKHKVGVVMDVVTNHCGLHHWWMQDLPFKDWVNHPDREDWLNHPEDFIYTTHLLALNSDANASEYDKDLLDKGWFCPTMPDMNLDNPYVLRYFQQWIVWWIEFADLDGLRVDTYPYNAKEPMSQWCKSVLEEYPNLNIVGECWMSNMSQLAYWQGGEGNRDGFDSHLPSIMDFPLMNAIRGGLTSDSNTWGGGLMRIYEMMSNDFVYKDLSNMLIFPGNHDTGRIADDLQGDKDKMKKVMTLMGTMRGLPQIFAGDEMGFRSKDLSQGHGGLRVDFPGGWSGDKVNLFDKAGRKGEKAELHDFTKKIFNWRKNKEVIHSGKTLHFATRDNTYAYFRYNENEAVFVYLNNSSEEKLVPWGNYSEITSTLKNGRDVMTGANIENLNDMKVAPKGILIIEFDRIVK